MANHIKHVKKCIAVEINGIEYDRDRGISTDPKLMMFCGADAERIKDGFSQIQERYRRGPNTIKSTEKIEEIYKTIKSVLYGARKAEPELISLNLKSEYDAEGNRNRFSLSLKGLDDEKEWDWEPQAVDKFFRGIETKSLYRL